MSKNNCVSFNWVINNFSYCWQKYDEAIVSPIFSIYVPEETKWKILLFPRGVASEAGCISFFLCRDKDCNGSGEIDVKYTLDIIHSDGRCGVGCTLSDKFQKGTRNGHSHYVNRNYVIKNPKEYLPRDSLAILCTILQVDDITLKKRQIFARTIIDFEKLSFQWLISDFSSMVYDQTRTFIIKSETKDDRMQINLTITNENKETILFGIDSFDLSVKFSAVKIFIIDSQKREVACGKYEYWFKSGKCTMFPLDIAKSKLMENKSLYLCNDVLTLRFELEVSTGFVFEGVGKVACKCHPISNEEVENWRKCFTHKKLTDCPCTLTTDVTSLLKDQSASDMKLQTKTDIFHVHTLILSARSPVFKAMFSNEMKEKINGCVDVSDLHDDTVRRFLLYLYSDQLEDIKWDDAVQLYNVADKYAVISLREKSSMFLKSNLNEGNICEALMLSDLHQDKDLKEMAQDFILKNANIIFKSEDWKQLMEANAKLALETGMRNWKDN